MNLLSLDFSEQVHRFEPGSSWARFRRFSPTGKVPTLQDRATVVWDSLAIIEYLAERHSGVWPGEAQARAWARCATAEMHASFAALRTQCSFNVGLRVRLHDIGTALQNDLDRMEELWSEGLRLFGGPYLAGPAFTAVDAFFAPIHFRVQTYGLKLAAETQAYSERVLALPAMKAWEAAALAEDFRDASHDEAVLSFGTIREDLRAPVAG